MNSHRPFSDAASSLASKDDDLAIDFIALMRAEKKRARDQKRNSKKKSEPGLLSASASASTAAASAASAASAATTTNLTGTAREGAPLSQWRHPAGFVRLEMGKFENQRQLSSSDGDYESGPLFECHDPPTIRYRSPILDSQAHDALVEWLYDLPSSSSGEEGWKAMKYGKRRVSMFAATNAGSRLPPPLDELARELTPAFPESEPPNHVLINEYQAGQGIMPHTDGPSYASCTATISLCSSVLLKFTKRQQNLKDERNEIITSSVLLEPNSIILFTQDAYSLYCHGIDMDVLEETIRHEDHCINAPVGTAISRELRYSLTFRHKFS